MEEIENEHKDIFHHEEWEVIKASDSGSESTELPLITRILASIGAWASAMVFMAFLILNGFLGESSISYIVFGVLFIAVGLFIQRIRTNVFTESLSFALVVIGFIPCCIGIADMVDFNTNFDRIYQSVTLFLVLGQVPVFLISRSRLLKFFSIAVGIYSFFLFTNSVFGQFGNDVVGFLQGVIVFALTYILLNEKEYLKNHPGIVKHYSILVHALALVILVTFVVPVNYSVFEHRQVSGIGLKLAPIFLMVSYIYFTLRLLKTHTTSRPKVILIYFLLLILGVLTYFDPATGVSILLLLLASHKKEAYLFVISILFFIYSMSHFYYDLEFTLLVKSYLLMGSGALLLMINYAFQKIKN
jgi:hypothetical protein